MRAVDYHTAGEPFRIVDEDAPVVGGATVAERRERAIADPAVQRVRALLCNEPRGHADMYGGFITPPDDAGADFGVLFWHKDGFSTACGHGSIALGVWAVHTGRTPPQDEATVRIDVPSGRVTVRVRCDDQGVPRAATFRNVPAYVVDRGIAAAGVHVDVAFSGALYASVSARDAGLAVTPEHLPALIAKARAIKAALTHHPVARHTPDPRLGGIYGVIFHDDLGDDHQRNVTVFADGEVDRSPCGSGTSARLALRHDDGHRTPLIHDSIVGTRFVGTVVEETPAGVITEVEGMAHRTATHEFHLDPDDPVGTGFVLR